MNNNDVFNKIIQRYSQRYSCFYQCGVKNDILYSVKPINSLYPYRFTFMCLKKVLNRYLIIIYIPYSIDNYREMGFSSHTIIFDSDKVDLSYEKIVDVIENNLKTYYDMQKKVLKNKVERL